MKMNRDFAQAWAEKLRRPEMKQVRGVLRVGDGYCCLGVACTLTPAGVWGPPDHEGERGFSMNGCIPRMGMPPMAAMMLWGSSGQEISLFAHLNDSFQWSFQMIADFIEAQPSRAEMQVLAQIAENIDRADRPTRAAGLVRWNDDGDVEVIPMLETEV